jgi:anti-sigma regulatory factor (Ser/Thr protein kinase)
MSDPDSRPTVFSLDRGPAPLSKLRQWITSTLSDLSAEHLTDLVLVCSELVSNAYEHGRHPRRIALWHRPRTETVYIEVDDAGQDLPDLRVPQSQEPRGRGLVLVDRLSRAWGTRLRERGKTVWAEMTAGLAPPRTAFDH